MSEVYDGIIGETQITKNIGFLELNEEMSNARHAMFDKMLESDEYEHLKMGSEMLIVNQRENEKL